ncbi:MAG: hypothetical protein IJE10_04275 [Clostridia bacterium]|nr:hypothetical protein [Clostridia bacterium]
MFRKTLSMVLVIAMLCTMLPAFALTASAETVADDVYTEGIPYLRKVINGLDENGTPKNEPIALPDSFEFNTVNDNASTSDLPAGELTYILTASTTPAVSNFTGTMTSSNILNPVTGNGNGIRQTEDVNATIVVPGPQAKAFQLVTVARSPSAAGNPGTVEVTIDGELVDSKLGGGHAYVGAWTAAGFGTTTDQSNSQWAVSPRWDWGNTVTLEPGVHEIDVKMKNGSSAGLYALVLSTARGYDWTKIHGLMAAVPQGSAASVDAFQNSFGAAGLLDYTAPAAVTGASAEVDFVEATLSWNGISEANGYNDVYAYTVTVEGPGYEKTKTTIDEEITFEGLLADTEYTYTIKAMDMVGNVGAAATGTFTTLSAADSDEAYFGAGATLSKIGATVSSLDLTWDSALLGALASGEITYNVYVEDELLENTAGNTITVSGLKAETEYDVKIVPVLNGVEGSFSALADTFATADLTYTTVTAGPLVAYETVNNGNGWTGNVTDSSLGGGNMAYRYWKSPDEAWAISDDEPCYFVGNNNSAAQTATVNVPENGNYYVVARGSVWTGTNRYLSIKIDGTDAQANTTEGTHFLGWGGGNNEPAPVGNTMVNDYSESPIALTAGEHTVTLATKNGWVRVDYAGLVKEADYDEDGDADNADIYWLLNNTLTSKEAVMEFFGFNLMKDTDVTMTQTEDNTVEIAWKPTTQAKGNKNLTFELYINGNKTKTYDYEGRSHTYSMSTDPENGGLGIGENVVKFVAKNGNTVLVEKEETFTITAEDITTAYFSGAALETPYNATTPVEDMTDTLEINWTAAIVNNGEFEGSYNVYVDDELVGNTADTAYEITGLTPGTEYEVKVAIVENEVELDSYITTLTKTFTTANQPEIALVGDAGETEVVLEITDMFEAEEYEIALYGSAAVWTLNDDGTVTITELLPGTRYEVTVKSTVASPYADEPITYVHKKFAFTTDGSASGEATYTSGMPILNGEYAEEQGKLGVDGGQNNNDGKWNYVSSDGYKGVFGQAGVPVFYAGSGHAVTFTVESPAEAQYYVGVETGCYDANARYVTVTVNGQTIDYRYTGQDMTKSVAPTPVTLNEGENTIVIKANGGWCRIDHVVFISANSQAKAMAEYSAANDATAMEGAFGIPSTMISEGNVILTQLGTDSVMVSWTPNEVARDKTLTYKLSLNGEPEVTLNNTARKYIFNTFDGLVLGTNTLKMTITDELGNEEVVNKTIEIATLLNVDVAQEMIVEGEGEDAVETEYVDKATITVSNPTGAVKKVKVMAVVYNGNRVIEKQIQDIDLLLSDTIVFDLETTNARAIRPTGKLSPTLTQVKYFVLDMDNNAYLPLEINY